jgi:hypothetical protein
MNANCPDCGMTIPAETRPNVHFSEGKWRHLLCPDYAVAGKAMADTATAEATAPDPAALLLEQAHKIVTGARRQAYGTPEDNFACIAGLWETYLRRRMQVLRIQDVRINAADVSAMMVLMKSARLAETQDHADSWRDTAGYAACGARASKADLSK